MDEHGHCHDYLRQFSDYIDHELTPEMRARIEAHLKECTNCSVVFNTLRRTVDLYRADGDDEQLPEGVRKRLFARLDLDNMVDKGSSNAAAPG